MASATTKASSIAGLAEARRGSFGQAGKDEIVLDLELKGEIDRYVMDSPETDPTVFTMIRGPPYDTTAIPQEMTKAKLKHMCRLYGIPASVGASVEGQMKILLGH